VAQPQLRKETDGSVVSVWLAEDNEARTIGMIVVVMSSLVKEYRI